MNVSNNNFATPNTQALNRPTTTNGPDPNQAAQAGAPTGPMADQQSAMQAKIVQLTDMMNRLMQGGGPNQQGGGQNLPSNFASNFGGGPPMFQLGEYPGGGQPPANGGQGNGGGNLQSTNGGPPMFNLGAYPGGGQPPTAGGGQGNGGGLQSTNGGPPMFHLGAYPGGGAPPTGGGQGNGGGVSNFRSSNGGPPMYQLGAYPGGGQPPTGRSGGPSNFQSSNGGPPMYQLGAYPSGNSGGTSSAGSTGGRTYDGAQGASSADAAKNAQAVAKVAREKGVDPVCAVACMLVESGGNANAVGDKGTSFGLFQLHQGGELGNMSQAQASDPTANATVALSQFARNSGKYSDPGQLAAASQRPANPDDYARKVDAKMPEARQLLGMA